MLADVVESVELLEVVPLTPLLLLADSCEFVEEEDEVPLWAAAPELPLLPESLAVPVPCI